MSARKWAIVLVVVGLVFFLAPFVPYTSASGHILGASYRVTADVSPSYYLFRCGSYINHEATATAQGFSSMYQITQGYTFTCNYNTG